MVVASCEGRSTLGGFRGGRSTPGWFFPKGKAPRGSFFQEQKPYGEATVGTEAIWGGFLRRQKHFGKGSSEGRSTSGRFACGRRKHVRKACGWTPTAIAMSASSALGGCLELLLFVLYTPGLAPVRGLFRLFAFSFEGIFLKKVAPVVLHGFWFRSEQIRRTQDEPQRIVAHRLLSHLQYLDSVKSSAKDLSLPRFEIMSSCKTFDGKSSSYATGSRPNACHATMEAMDNTDQPDDSFAA